MLHRLPIARAIGGALRLAAHPGKALVRPQKDLEQVLKRLQAPTSPCHLAGVTGAPMWAAPDEWGTISAKDPQMQRKSPFATRA